MNLSTSKEETKTILSELGINPYDYKHEELEASEISELEAIMGALKISDVSFQVAEKEFHISLTDYRDGSKSLNITQKDDEAVALEEMINKYYDIFGTAEHSRKAFSKEDEVAVLDNSPSILREWQLSGFKISIGYHKNQEMAGSFILVEEL